MTFYPHNLTKFINQNYGSPEGNFLSDIYQKRNRNKEIRTEIKTKISRLIDLLYHLNDIVSR